MGDCSVERARLLAVFFGLEALHEEGSVVQPQFSNLCQAYVRILIVVGFSNCIQTFSNISFKIMVFGAPESGLNRRIEAGFIDYVIFEFYFRRWQRRARPCPHRLPVGSLCC